MRFRRDVAGAQGSSPKFPKPLTFNTSEHTFVTSGLTLRLHIFSHLRHNEAHPHHKRSHLSIVKSLFLLACHTLSYALLFLKALCQASFRDA